MILMDCLHCCYLYGYPAPFGGRLAVALADGCLRVQVGPVEAFPYESLDHTGQATLGELLVVAVCARRTGLGHEGKPMAAHAAGKGFEVFSFLTAHIGAVVGKLHEVRGLHRGGRLCLSLFTVGQAALQFGLLLLCPLAVCRFAFGTCLFRCHVPLQGVHAIVERGEFALVVGSLHLGTARHEVVAYGGKGENEVLRGDVLAIEKPVRLAFQSDGEAAAHVGLDVERGGNVERVELLVAVRRAHVTRDGYLRVVADGRTVTNGRGLSALCLRVADVDAVLVALGKGVAYARAQPDVQPLRAAAGPQLWLVRLLFLLELWRLTLQ